MIYNINNIVKSVQVKLFVHGNLLLEQQGHLMEVLEVVYIMEDQVTELERVILTHVLIVLLR